EVDLLEEPRRRRALHMETATAVLSLFLRREDAVVEQNDLYRPDQLRARRREDDAARARVRVGVEVPAKERRHDCLRRSQDDVGDLLVTGEGGEVDADGLEPAQELARVRPHAPPAAGLRRVPTRARIEPESQRQNLARAVADALVAGRQHDARL